MYSCTSSVARGPCVRPLAAAMALAIALGAAGSPASGAVAANVDDPALRPSTDLVVTNCNDDGAGSLRAALRCASSTDRQSAFADAP